MWHGVGWVSGVFITQDLVFETSVIQPGAPPLFHREPVNPRFCLSPLPTPALVIEAHATIPDSSCERWESKLKFKQLTPGAISLA